MDRSSSPSPSNTRARQDYWEGRRHLMYYKYVDVLVRAFAAEATSLLDVGSWNTPLIEDFDWIPRRDALDLRSPYQSPRVRGIKADFLSFAPDLPYDFATCLQVLEHIPDAERFARHLFEVAANVLISVPFRWPEGRTVHHAHDPIDLAKLTGWVGRKPSYHLVVTEPLTSVKGQRLIAYYHSPSAPFSLAAIRQRTLPPRA